MFTVIDPRTGREPTPEELRVIARDEEWAKDRVCWVDAIGFAINQHGELLFIDSIDNYCECPPDRFEVRDNREELINILENEFSFADGEPVTNEQVYDCVHGIKQELEYANARVQELLAKYEGK